jgi:hypothetical protein
MDASRLSKTFLLLLLFLLVAFIEPLSMGLLEYNGY